MSRTPDSKTTAPSSGSTSPGEEKALPFNSQTNYVPRRRIITIFLACASVDLVSLIDQTTLAVSLSIISSALEAGQKSAWIANAYFITTTSFQLLYGRLSDIFSRKVVLLAGLFIFFLGSLASSLATSAVQLIAFRALCGFGGGGLTTIAQIIVSDVVSLRDRGKYQGILGAVVALSNGVGPLIGGALASQSADSWRWIFRLNLPVSVFTGFCVVFFMPLRKVEGSWSRKLKAVDWAGIVLTLASSTVLVLGLTWAGGEYSWGSPHVIAALCGGCAILGVFVGWEWKGAAYPLMPVHIYKTRMVNGACITMFVNGWNFVVQLYQIPQFYQLAYGYSAVRAGALILPIVLVQTLSSTLSGFVVTWRGRYRESILFGWVCWAIGLGLFSTLKETDGLGKQIGYGILTGVGVGQTLQPSLIAIQAGVPRSEMAVVTATRNFVRNLGASLGLAVAGTIVTNTLRRSLNISSTELKRLLDEPLIFEAFSAVEQKEILAAYREGFRWVFITGAALCAFAFVAAAALMPQINLDRADEEKKEPAQEAEEVAVKEEGDVELGTGMPQDRIAT